EPSETEPGVFWLNAAGLVRLCGSLAGWAQAIHASLQEAGFEATVVVGFSRFGTYAAAKAGQGVVVFTTPADEQAAVRCLPLAVLTCAPALREELSKLGVQTVGDFLHLPVAGVGERFGPEASHLHRWAAGAQWRPLRPRAAPELIQQQMQLDTPDTEAPRLLFV